MRPKPLTNGNHQYGALIDYWYPAAWSQDVADKPGAVQVLGTPIVLWRSGGECVAFYDLCIHRGTPLSLGRVSADGELICAYHGWHYDCRGACTWIPSRPRDRSIPANARATPFHVKEKYGLVWVSIGDPRGDVPEFPPEFQDEDYFVSMTADDVWECNAARFVENMMDNSHFAWVHPGILGTQEHPIVKPITVHEYAGGMTYTCTEPIGNMVEPDREHIRQYELTFPFMILFRVHQPGRDERDVIWYVCNPMTTKTTRFFYFARRNYRHPMPDDERMAQARVVQEQDKRMVEAQRPEELPLDLREELHLRGPDDVALRYRQKLASFGIDWG